MSGTELLELDPAAGSGQTRSGRRYTLGRLFDAMDIGGKGEEARAAFEHLLTSEFEGIRLAQVISEGQVQGGLRRVLLTKATRLKWLAERRYVALGVAGSVRKEGEDEE
jgi:hypothetical protein